MSLEWIKTDNTQWLKKSIKEGIFQVIDIVTYYDGKCIWVKDHIVDVNDFSDEELEKEVESYYSSLEDVKRIYGDHWKQIIAEIIVENMPNEGNDKLFTDEDELILYLKRDYSITNYIKEEKG